MAASMALGDLAVDSLPRAPLGPPPRPPGCSLELGSSFHADSHSRRGRPAPALLTRQPRRRRRGLVVFELGEQYEEGFDDVRAVTNDCLVSSFLLTHQCALVGKSRPLGGLMVDFIICPHWMPERRHGPMRNAHSGQSHMVKRIINRLMVNTFSAYWQRKSKIWQKSDDNTLSSIRQMD
ncbi:RbcX protein [Musa troglodytarum]|uniref:RbcX protein n=1 Tax=Musa troglodytarum TaxID=320322 RepID=A0A9E7FW38_9LILI|nr:RbcX protein [Musa troglodytarum]